VRRYSGCVHMGHGVDTSRASHQEISRRDGIGALTADREPARLIMLELAREGGTVSVQDDLAAIEERHLQVEIVQNLEERWLQPRDLEPVLDTPNKSYGVDLWSDVLQQSANEGCRRHQPESQGKGRGFTRTSLRVSQKILP
jgi:hypothetical protein